ncbi:MAG: N-acetylmuramoyl-L-alanine amidase [Mariniphaga sp.]
MKSYKLFNLRTYISTLYLFISFFSFSQEPDSLNFTAKSGDNIYRILQNNGLTDSHFMEDFIILNKSKLGKDNALIIGRTYILPKLTEQQTDTINIPQIVVPLVVVPQVKFITEPLFGKDAEHVDLIDQKLKGGVFYLVSGHGGPDPGAMGKIGKNILCEDEYAYDVTLRFGRELLRHSAKVYFIVRDPYDGIRNDLFLRNNKDEVCYPNSEIPLNQVERLKQRVDAINVLYRNEHQGIYKRCIEIHVDARNNKKNIDLFFYFNEGSKNGERLANTLRTTVEQKYQLKQPGRGYTGDVSSRNLYMLKKTIPTAVFIELGNINHSRDQQRLIYENNRQAIAKWLCDGVIEDFGK